MAARMRSARCATSDAGRGERDLAWPPLNQLRADLALEFPHLHGKGRLRHRAIVGGAAEMPVARERREVAQLSQGDHFDKIILSIRRTQYD